MLADLKAGQFDHPPRNRPAPDECRRVKALEAHIATLEEAVAKAEALGEQRRREAETAAKRGRRSRCRARRDDERALGHTVRLMPSAYVKPYLKQERAQFKMIFNVCRDERAEFWPFNERYVAARAIDERKIGRHLAWKIDREPFNTSSNDSNQSKWRGSGKLGVIKTQPTSTEMWNRETWPNVARRQAPALVIVLNRKLSGLIKDDCRPSRRSTLEWAYQYLIQDEAKLIE
jgi:hypothetical protein